MDETSKKVVMHLQSAQNRILLKNGTVVNHDGCKVADVYIEDSIIKQVGNHLIIPGGTRTIDVLGKLIIPGGIDPNVHFQSPVKTEGSTEAPNGTRTIDDFYVGTKAALAGGTTTVIDLVKPDIGESLVKGDIHLHGDDPLAKPLFFVAFDKWQAWAEESACCDFSFKVKLPEKLTQPMVDEMRELTVDNYAVNCFQASLERFNDEELIEFFDTCSSLGCVAQVVFENGELVKRNVKKILEQGVTGPEGFPLARSEEAEEEATLRACTLASQMNCPLYLPHLSCKGSFDIVKAKKKKDQVVLGEVNPAILARTGKGYLEKDWKRAAALIIDTPLRNDQLEDLNEAFAKDDQGLDLSGSNHAAFNSNQKALGIKDFTKIPIGGNGVQERMSVIWEKGVQSGNMSPERFVSVTSATAAKIFGLYPDKGYIDVGSQADIVVWDPQAITTISSKNQISKSDLNIYEGMTVQGRAEYVILRGRVVVDEGELKAVQGHGRFIPLSPYPAHVYEKIKSREMFKFNPVIRDEHDLAVNGGEIPPPAAAKSFQPEKAPSQHISHFDLKSHPHDPEPPIENNNLARTKHRSSIRIKNPPGGRSSGSFW